MNMCVRVSDLGMIVGWDGVGCVCVCVCVQTGEWQIEKITYKKQR